MKQFVIQNESINIDEKEIKNHLDTLVYIAYGSNLGGKEMSLRCPGACKLRTTLLSGYNIKFKGESNGYLTIEENHSGKIPVVLWKLTKEDLSNLDEYEVYGILYDRIIIDFKIGETLYKGFTYVMKDHFKVIAPTIEYYNLCQMLYHENGFLEYLPLLDNALEETKRLIGKLN